MFFFLRCILIYVAFCHFFHLHDHNNSHFTITPIVSTTARVRRTKEWHVLHIAALAPLPVPPFYGPGLYQVRTLDDTCWWFSFWHYQYQHRKSQAWVTLNVVVLHASFSLFMCCVVFTLPLRSLLTLVYIGTVSSAGWGEWSEASRYVFIFY
jgi:hypothetical protein